MARPNRTEETAGSFIKIQFYIIGANYLNSRFLTMLYRAGTIRFEQVLAR